MHPSTKKPVSRSVQAAEAPAVLPLPTRQAVRPEWRAWDAPAPGYAPPYYVAAKVLAEDETQKPGGWADPEDVSQVRHAFTSHTGPLRRDALGRPLNPTGRTGLAGRGLLGRWGPNHAADAVVLRRHPASAVLELLAIQRADTGHWALPGGMIDQGEGAADAATRELCEETGVEVDMRLGVRAFAGIVDDPRNTDHAWTESTAFARLLEPATAARLVPRASEESLQARWQPVDAAHLGALYASHAEIVRRALAALGLAPA